MCSGPKIIATVIARCFFDANRESMGLLFGEGDERESDELGPDNKGRRCGCCCLTVALI